MIAASGPVSRSRRSCARSTFLEARQLASSSSLGGATTGRQLLDRLQSLFPVGGGRRNALAEFFAAANGVANSPQDRAATSCSSPGRRSPANCGTRRRSQTLQRGKRRAGGVRRQCDLAELGATEPRRRRRAWRSRSNDLRDQRQVALGELAKQLSIQVEVGAV
jgi:hypothetical protein